MFGELGGFHRFRAVTQEDLQRQYFLIVQACGVERTSSTQRLTLQRHTRGDRRFGAGITKTIGVLGLTEECSLQGIQVQHVIEVTFHHPV